MAVNERTALLARESREDEGPSVDINSNSGYLSTDYDSEEDDTDDDEPLDVLVDRYTSGENMNAPGLSGSLGAFSSSLRHRSSTMAFSFSALSRTTSRTDTLRHRPSRPSMARPTASRQPSRSSLKPAFLKKTKTAQGEDMEAGEIKTGGKYLVDIGELRFWAIFVSIFLTWFVACFDSTLMASSHPIISTYFDASNEASWFSTSFLLTSSSFAPIFARVSDTWGRRVSLIFGLLAFGFGTLWCALAPTILHFILARALCGLGAGASINQGAIIVSDLLPLRRRGAYLSWLNLSYGIGCSLGAALGGFLAESIGWRWEFGIQVPAVFAVLAVVYFAVPYNLGPELAKHNPRPLLQTLRTFDLLGSIFLGCSSVSLILFLNTGGNTLPWTHPLIPTFFVMFLVFGIVLIRVERRAEKPVMPLHMLLHIPRGNLVFSNFLNSMTMNTVLFNIPLYFQATLLDSPTRSGTRLIIPFVTNMVAAFATGHTITYTGRIKPTLVLGYTLIFAGLISLSFMSGGLPTYVYAWFVALPMIGQGFSFPTVSIAQLAVTSIEDMAVATSTLMLFRNLGVIMGVSFSSLVAQNSLLYYLMRLVDGPDKMKVISDVRKAVETVKELPPIYQQQVIQAYSLAMRVTFMQGIVTAGLALSLVIFIRLPRLTEKFEQPPPAE